MEDGYCRGIGSCSAVAVLIGVVCKTWQGQLKRTPKGGENERTARPLSMMRVLHTSSGVVRPAAIPPATLPHAAASIAGRSRTRPEDVRRRARSSFMRSYIGNWRQVKGICCLQVSSTSANERGKAHLASNSAAEASVEALQCRCRPNRLGYSPAAYPFGTSLTPLFHDFCRYSNQACSLTDRAESAQRRPMSFTRLTTSPPLAESMCNAGANSSVPSFGNSSGSWVLSVS